MNRATRRYRLKERSKQKPTQLDRAYTDRVKGITREDISRRKFEYTMQQEQHKRHLESQWPLMELFAYVPESARKRTEEYYARKAAGESDGETTV